MESQSAVKLMLLAICLHHSHVKIPLKVSLRFVPFQTCLMVTRLFFGCKIGTLLNKQGYNSITLQGSDPEPNHVAFWRSTFAKFARK